MTTDKPPQHPIHKHHYHSPIKRGIYSLVLVSFILLLGTLGFHFIEGFAYIDSFYLTSMLATGQGPAPSVSPSTSLGKLFTSLIAFISVGSMVAAFGFLFGPFFGKLWRIGVVKLEEELQHLHKEKG